MTNREKFKEVFGCNPEKIGICTNWWYEEFEGPGELKIIFTNYEKKDNKSEDEE